METIFSCTLCPAPVAVVPVRLRCCNELMCLTCARDMFGLNTLYSKPCRLCNAFAPDDISMSGKNFYVIRYDLFQSFDDIKESRFECPRACSFVGTTNEIHTHLKIDCPNAHTKCPKCGCRIIRSSLAAHAPLCRIRRTCFCQLESVCKVSSYKKHIEEHTTHEGYDELCKRYTDPDAKKPKMLCCKILLHDGTPNDVIGVFSGCSCGGIFTLPDFVNHVRTKLVA